MRAFDIVALVFLFIVLFVALFILWYNLPGKEVEFLEYKSNISVNLSQKSAQFYPNMRYPDRVISYSLDDNCGPEKQGDFERAADILEQNTLLDFTRKDGGEIVVFCSNLSPEPEEEGHFIAGEGGPTEIINASEYAVILAGKISLYRPENCDIPQVALHELLHALGFDHNKNEQSIMYPITDCDQQLDQYIINDINSLYSQPSYPDVLVEDLEANKTGRYLNFDIVVANHGLKKAANSTLSVEVEDIVIKKFDLGALDIGAKKSLMVSNLKISRSSGEIVFKIETTQAELDKTNNVVKIGMVQ